MTEMKTIKKKTIENIHNNLAILVETNTLHHTQRKHLIDILMTMIQGWKKKKLMTETLKEDSEIKPILEPETKTSYLGLKE